jgi:hypothetical protein
MAEKQFDFKASMEAIAKTGFYSQLGEFIVGYALAEGAIHQVARKLAGVNDAKGRVLFAGMRLGDVQSRARGLLQHTRYGNKTRKTIEDCLSQFDRIGLMRDKIIHRFTHLESGELKITNFFTAKNVLAVEQDAVSQDDLYGMEVDCWTIATRLLRICNPDMRKMPSHATKFWRGPWRYKPAQPNNPKKPSPATKALVEALLRSDASKE